MLIEAAPLTRENFALFGQVIEKEGSDSFAINKGKCQRHHALATAEISGAGASTVINIFAGQPYAIPHTVDLVERHPLGTQAFYPLGRQPWLVVVCEDQSGQPVNPQAFLATANQGINLKKNVWHGVLTPLIEASDFLVVDRAGDGNNLEEYELPKEEQFTITATLG